MAETIKINELPVASAFSGVIPQAAGGTNKTEQVNSAQIATKLRESYDIAYADKTETEQALLLKADADSVYTKIESDGIYKSYTAPHFCLYHSAAENISVGPATYSSPGATISTESTDGFIYSGGSLTWNGPTRKFKVTAEISYSATGTNTTTNFYWGKNWTSGPPSELNSITQRETDPQDKALITCSWVMDLNNGDTLDVVINANQSSTLTILAGKYIGELI